MLALLNGADGAGFVEVALVVGIKLAKGILKAKDITLLELGIFPRAREIQNWVMVGQWWDVSLTSVAL
jgi:hypothetical protein